MQLKTGILLTPSPKILDVFDRFFGRKNVRLGVNGNAARRPKFNQRKLYDYDDDEEEEAIAQTQLKQD